MGAPWLLAVFMEALQECCNYILLVLFITWIRLLSSKQRGAYFLVFSDSFASLFSIHGKLISSSAIVLSSLCKLIILASKFSLLWLECSQHKLWHIPISFSALVFVHWFDFQLVRKAKTQGGWCRSDPVFFSNSKKRFLIVSSKVFGLRQSWAARKQVRLVLAIFHTFCMWQQMMDLIPFFSSDTPSLEGAAGAIPVRPRWY